MLARIFKNLNRGGKWSIQIKLNGRFTTVAIAESAELTGAAFFARESTRLRLLPLHAREVHAWVDGQLTAVSGAVLIAKYETPEIAAEIAAVSTAPLSDLPVSISYRPFERADFRIRATGAVIEKAPRARFTVSNGCTIDSE
jgi:hypothetical protein